MALLPPFPPIPVAVDISTLALRSVAGAILTYHGYLKIDRGAGIFADFVHGSVEIFGVSMPRAVGFLVIVLEVLALLGPGRTSLDHLLGVDRQPVYDVDGAEPAL